MIRNLFIRTTSGVFSICPCWDNRPDPSVEVCAVYCRRLLWRRSSSSPHGGASYPPRADVVCQLFFLGSAIALSLWLNAIWIPILWFVSPRDGFLGTQGTHVLRPTALRKFVFFPHNTCCHYEYHEHPYVPCWALPNIRDPSTPTVTMGELFASFLVGNPSRNDNSDRSRQVQEGLI